MLTRTASTGAPTVPDVYPTRYWIINGEAAPDPSIGHGFLWSAPYIAGPGHRGECRVVIPNPSGTFRVYQVGAQAKEDGGDWQPCNAGVARCDIQWCWFIGNPGVTYDAGTNDINVWFEFFNESHNRTRAARIVALIKGHVSGGVPPFNIGLPEDE